MKQKTQDGFVIEIQDRAILALSATSMRRAREICSQQWFADELLHYRSCGSQIWDGVTPLSIRRATACELAELEIARVKELVEEQQDEFIFAFLVPLDADMN